MNSNLQKQQEPFAPAESAVTEGDVIGAEGVLLGREEKRDWLCDGVVEGFSISVDQLKLRAELLAKMKKALE